MQITRRIIPLWTILAGLFVAVWFAFFFSHPEVLTKVGVGHYRIEVAPERYHELWFLDTFAILASNDAVAAGANPYAPNRVDYLRRPHVYGPAWLYLHRLGLTRMDTFVVGSALAVAFALAAVLFLRPASLKSFAWSMAVFCTAPILAAVERGNNDLVVFLLLTPVVPVLLGTNAGLRWLAVLLIAVATALKYYPAAASILLLANASPSEVRRRMLAIAIALALVGWHVLASVPSFALLPVPNGLLTFGAVALIHELGIAGSAAQLAALVLGFISFCVWWRAPILRDWKPRPAEQRNWMYFTLGSALLCFCFFVGKHYAYRWVLTLWLAPLLWSLSRDSLAPAGVRRLAQITAGLLLVTLWAEAIFAFATHRWANDEMLRAARWMGLGLQPFTWAFILCLLGFLAKFVRDGWLVLITKKNPVVATRSAVDQFPVA